MDDLQHGIRAGSDAAVVLDHDLDAEAKWLFTRSSTVKPYRSFISRGKSKKSNFFSSAIGAGPSR
jgi:hypothetical protein